MIRPTPAIEAIPSTTPFVGPEQLMRETGRAELVRLGANESPFGPSARAVAAMRAELEHSSWYGDPESLDLRDALAVKHGCSADRILVGAGIDDLMGLAVRAFVAPGAIALTTRGSYPTFNYHVVGYRGELAFVDYREDGTLDLDALLRVALERRPAIVYLANPDNPSGSFADADALGRFYAGLPPETLLFLDEAYADYVSPDEIATMPFEDRLVRARTFSKAYGLAGARIGYVLTTQRNVQTFQKIRLQYGVNRNAQVGALASLEDDNFVPVVVRETRAAIRAYCELADEVGCGYIASRTNFLCIDMGSTARATRVMHRLLEYGVWIRKPGAPPLDRFIRVSAGTAAMRERFAQALRQVLTEERVSR